MIEVEVLSLSFTQEQEQEAVAAGWLTDPSLIVRVCLFVCLRVGVFEGSCGCVCVHVCAYKLMCYMVVNVYVCG